MVKVEWFIEKAINFSDIFEIWMLKNESPLCEIPLVVEIGYGNLCKPMLLVVSLHMPVHPDRARVVCTAEVAHCNLLVSPILPYLKV